MRIAGTRILPKTRHHTAARFKAPVARLFT
jgi:hypothetical protein